MHPRPPGKRARTDDELRTLFRSQPRNPKTGCWEWSEGRSNGYGNGMRKGRKIRAHRLSYLLFKADPGRLFVCHRCDNRCCVNPEHLFLGSQADNLDDMWRKGRASSSAQRRTYGNRKLTEEDVAQIDRLRSQGLTQQQIADRFGLHQTAISKVLRRASWSHLRKS